MFFLLFWKIAIIPKRAAVFISISFFLSGLNSYHVVLLHLIKILSMSNFIFFFLSFLLHFMYLFLWCVWFRLKVQRHKETKMKKQTNSHTSEQGQVYSRQRVLIWKAFRSCSQTKCRKEKQCFHYLSVIHVRMTYLFSADHLLMKHELMDRSVGRRRGSWYNNYSPPQTKSSKLMAFFLQVTSC